MALLLGICGCAAPRAVVPASKAANASCENVCDDDPYFGPRYECMDTKAPRHEGVGVLRGELIDPKTSRPLGGVTVIVWDVMIRKPQVVEADAAGRFRFERLPMGVYSVTYSNPDTNTALGANECVVVDGGSDVEIAYQEPSWRVRQEQRERCAEENRHRQVEPSQSKIHVHGRESPSGKSVSVYTTARFKSDCGGAYFEDLDARLGVGEEVIESLPPGTYEVTVISEGASSDQVLQATVDGIHDVDLVATFDAEDLRRGRERYERKAKCGCFDPHRHDRDFRPITPR